MDSVIVLLFSSFFHFLVPLWAVEKIWIYQDFLQVTISLSLMRKREGRWVFKDFVPSPIFWKRIVLCKRISWHSENMVLVDMSETWAVLLRLLSCLLGLKAVWKIRYSADLRQLAVPRSGALYLGWSVSMGKFIAQSVEVCVCCQASCGWGFAGTDVRSQYLKLGKGASEPSVKLDYHFLALTAMK